MWGNVQDIDIWIQKLNVLSSFHFTFFPSVTLHLCLSTLLFFYSFVSCALYYLFFLFFRWKWLTLSERWGWRPSKNVDKKHDSWHKNKSHIDDWFFCSLVARIQTFHRPITVHSPSLTRMPIFFHHVNSMFTDVYKLCDACLVYLTMNKRTTDTWKRIDFIRLHALINQPSEKKTRSQRNRKKRKKKKE